MKRYGYETILPEYQIIYKDIPDYGEHVTIEKFIEWIESSCVIDWDGTGYYATENKQSNIYAHPSEIYKGIINTNFTHVVWYNK